MAILYPSLTGSRSLTSMLQELRPEDRLEALAAPHLAQIVMSEAKWQWCLEGDAGQFIAGMAIIPDLGAKGWLVSYPGAAITTGLELRPMLRIFKILGQMGVYSELRAWVCHDDPRAIRFAKAFGFVYDCGPATGLSPTGRDMDLFIWRAT
jgi:hypothetical protein